MKIEHIAIWTTDLERLRAFYETYFGTTANQKYVNPRKGFSSYFLSFSSGARVELMQRADIKGVDKGLEEEVLGYAHFAIEVGDEAAVNKLTQRLVDNGIQLLDGPRYTGDGYYESVILDPDGNRIEITAQ